MTWSPIRMVEKVAKLGSLKWLARVNVFYSSDFSPSNCLMGELVKESRNHVYFNTVFKQGQRNPHFFTIYWNQRSLKGAAGSY